MLRSVFSQGSYKRLLVLSKLLDCFCLIWFSLFFPFLTPQAPSELKDELQQQLALNDYV